jgi:apolipoprotein D and lipocalin family protein
MQNKLFWALVALTTALGLTACTGKPNDITPVKNFQAEKYVGTWYEIARLDNRFEKGLTHVSATYSLRDDGGVSVLNRGYSRKNNQWKESLGKAYFVEDKNTAYLKVSFFGPFYGSYVVFDLDENYQYSLVTGNDKSYFWLLARTPTMSGEVKAQLLEKATALGFDTTKLVFVEQTETKQ